LIDDLKPDGREQSGTAVDLNRKIIMNTKLYVGNLAFSMTEQELQTLFSAHGPVNEVHVPMDRESGRPRGFAFVTMSTPEAAQAAILALNGKEIASRALTVNEARPREERGGGGGGGGGYDGGRGRRSY